MKLKTRRSAAPKGTYVYGVVAGARRPALDRVASGLAGLGRPRLIDVGPGRWLVAADAPLDRYGEEAINRRLSDLDWVSRAAVAHEAVVESFDKAAAILPMKLFTIFSSDERAQAHLLEDRRRIDTLIERVDRQREWGVRVVLDRTHLAGIAKPQSNGGGRGAAGPGARFLSQKKAARDASIELAERARATVGDLYDRLAAASSRARRRTAAELPVKDGPLLLDAAFLVPIARATSFRRLVARRSRALSRHGYRITLSGPWPPYSFVQD